MTSELDLDDPRAIEAALPAEMAARDLVWDKPPVWYQAPAVGTASGVIDVIDGRILSMRDGRSVFIGPEVDDLTFWSRARYAVIDGFCEEVDEPQP